ncbi:hypothetical protein OA105_01950 [Prochlorococcus sp. AH-736-B08]|nr:hypothetical protein [Prochlorococcus sp. AH-736-B08]
MPDKEFNYELQKHLEKEIPELLLPAKPTLDEIICAFLEDFDVFVKPSTFAKRDRLGDAVAGGVLGAINPYAIAVDQGLKSQNRMEKNQKVTEWIQWKQWALAHPDFFDYKQNILLKFEDKAYEIRELANEPEMQERISEVKRKFIKNQKLRRRLSLVIVLIVMVLVIVVTVKDLMI